MRGNPFWQVVTELYPMFLWICALVGVWRMSVGVWDRLNGREDGIGNAIKDISVGFFFAHTAIPLVLLIYVIMQSVGTKLTSIVNTFSNMP